MKRYKLAIMVVLIMTAVHPVRSATWFLPDYYSSGRGNNARINKSLSKPPVVCADYGLQNICPPPQSGIQVRPFAGLICYKNCRCPVQYKYSTRDCQPPYYLSGGSCGGKYTDCRLNVEEACRHYRQSCPPGWQMSASGRCPYDNTYGTCCNQCLGFSYAEIPQGYRELNRCESCDGPRYQVEINPCEGYSECRYGAEAGAQICYSGAVKKYSACKPCANECALAACPAGSSCRYESCSRKYCAVGCAINWQLIRPECADRLSCWTKIESAQLCFKPADCGALGYTKTWADCWCKTALRCPYDPEKLFCAD